MTASSSQGVGWGGNDLESLVQSRFPPSYPPMHDDEPP